MQRLEVSGAVRPIYGSLGVKRLITEVSQNIKFSRVFEKLREVTIGFVMAVRLSVRMEQLGCQQTHFYEI